VGNGNNYVWGFKERTGAGGGLGAASWEVGDPYGVEIARLDLPKGYIFGTNPPRDEKLNSATPKEVFFDPDELSPSMSPGSVQISLMRPSQGGMLKPHPVGTISSSMLKDTNN
jgi:hypothetical protein